MALRIGLTGGIAAGKTTAARLFERLGAGVIDADQIARELVLPGRPAFRAIVETFGPEFLTPKGELDRRRLRRLVFSDQRARRTLEAILHPKIFRELRRRAEACSAPYCLLVIPLLVETGAFDLVDRVLVVDCPEPLQRRRLEARGLEPWEIEAVLAAQASRSERLRNADEVLDGGGTLEDLRRQVEELHRFYLELARKDGPA